MTTARSAPRSRTTVSRYGWAIEDPARIGVALDCRPLPDDDLGFDDHVNDLIDTITTCRAGESFLLWTKYRALAAIHDQIAAGSGDDDARLVSEQSGVAARYAVTGAISQHVAAKHVNEAVAMVHRLPRTGERLRDGILAPWQFTRIVSRSDLIDGEGYRLEVDEEIAKRVAKGSWSGKRLDALVDSVIFRYDPDAVRRRHEDAKQARSVTADPLADGMAELRTTATVEDVKTAFAAVTALVKRVCCPNDPRRRAAQRSDAVIARLNGVAFECECGNPEACTGQPDQAGLTPEQVVIALHIITEQATLNAQSGDAGDGVGYVDGYGVITGDHVRDIAARSDTKISYFPGPPTKNTEPQPDSQTAAKPDSEPVLDFNTPPQPETEPESARPEPEPESESDAHPEFEPDPADDQPAPAVPEPAANDPVTEAPAPLLKPKPPVLPSPCLRSDPYRFSTAFDTYIRARDLACDVPGCDRPAFAAQLDHCWEYNHDNPTQGGRTEARNVHVLCVFHHLLKTGDHGWLDDLTIDSQGRVRYRIRTPEGLWIDGPDLSGNDLFDTLNHIRFAAPPNQPGTTTGAKPRPRRAASTSDKHQRRQREREQNRAERQAAEAAAERERIGNELFKYWRIRFPGANPTNPTNNNESMEQDDNPPPF